MKHKFAGLLMAGVMMCSMAVSASAAEVTDATQSPAPTTTPTVSTTDTNALTTQSKVPAYPVDIQYPTEEGGLIRKTRRTSTFSNAAILSTRERSTTSRTSPWRKSAHTTRRTTLRR